MIDTATVKSQTTIADVLDHGRIPHRRGRCACPIHGGSNPTSFSFDDLTWFCHACGRGGDILTLVQHLRGVDFLGSLRILRDEFGVRGIDIDDARDHDKPGTRKPRPIRLEGVELTRLKDQLHISQLVHETLTGYTARLRQRLYHGKIDLPHFYAEEQRLEILLDEIDSSICVLRHGVRKLKQQQRGKLRSGERLKESEVVRMKSKEAQSSGDNEVRL